MKVVRHLSRFKHPSRAAVKQEESSRGKDCSMCVDSNEIHITLYFKLITSYGMLPELTTEIDGERWGEEGVCAHPGCSLTHTLTHTHTHSNTATTLFVYLAMNPHRYGVFSTNTCTKQPR